MKLRNYYEARNWLEQFIPQIYTKKNLGLARIKLLLKLLGNPEEKFKSILIGGTSGKGSTAFYLARALQISSRFTVHGSQTQKINGNFSVNRQQTTDNLKIGLHISPHLTYIGERMQINGKPIAPNKLVELINEVRLRVESMEKTKVGLPSYFEILVAVSFLYFAREKVDWAVVEVGLGGRLDATNVLNQDLSIITNVGLDHTDILGKTLEEITKEKAGIIKQVIRKSGNQVIRLGVPVVTAASGRALEVIEKIAKDKKSPLRTINTLRREDRVYFDQLRNIKDKIDADSDSGAYVTDECFFLVNLSLQSLGFMLGESDQLNVFSARFAARFEEIDDGILIDGAHNKDKARALIKWVQKKLQKSQRAGERTKIILICAFKKRKDWKGILRLILGKLDIEKVYATKFNAVTDTGLFGSVAPEEIADYIESKWKVKVESFDNSQEAVREAVENKALGTRHQALVLVTGSLYLAGEARTIWELPES